jgi:prophage regulatory protein
MDTTNYTSHRALRAARVLEKTGISRTHLYRLIQQGEFPPPSKLSERVSVWDESAIDNWLDTKFGGAK